MLQNDPAARVAFQDVMDDKSIMNDLLKTVKFAGLLNISFAEATPLYRMLKDEYIQAKVAAYKQRHSL